MGYKHDQRLPSEIHEEYLAAQQQEAADAEEPLPPYSAVAAASSSSYDTPNPDPPASSSSTLYLASASPDPEDHPYPSSNTSLNLFPPGLSANDPRSTSQESITPTQLSSDGRRILLLVYIHGFVGDETSFGSFPAHVHSLLTPRVAGSHVVHTKVYPKYKTRRSIGVVRDQFSTWLNAREGPATDIILVGHSMGGILAAEVALMPGGPGQMSNPGGLRHRLLGTLNLDVPFLGMHPKVIGAGLSSLFAGAPADKKEKPMPYLSGEGAASTATVATGRTEVGSIDSVTTASTGASLTPASSLSPVFSASSGGSSLQMPAHNDQYFNPAYTNDSRVPTRTAFSNLNHFINKHAMTDGLLKAGTNYVSSHLEFGGTMADYRRLDRRYKHLRALEKEEWGGVHFINYFTTCEGRPKPVKAKKPAKTKRRVDIGKKKADADSQKADSTDAPPAEDPDILASTKDDIHANEEEEEEEEEDLPTGEMEELTLTLSDPVPVSDTESEGHYTPSSDGSFQDAQDFIDDKPKGDDETTEQAEDKDDGLPPIPPAPVPPAAFDASKYTDKDALKAGEKLHSRQLKAYQQAFKDREKVIWEREKLIKKREEKKRKDEEKALKESLKQAKVQSKETAKEEQRKRAEEKNAEKEQQKKLKQLEKEALREKKEADKAEKARLKEEEREKKRKQKEEAAAAAQAGDGGDDSEDEEEDEEGAEGEDDAQPTILKKRKLKTFCMTPPKATAARRKDWIPVFVADVDQVGAHCGLFRADQPHYEPFVERVVDRIEDWVDDLKGTIEL